MKILAVVDKGFEELECVGAIALWIRAGMIVDICAVNGEEETGRFGINLGRLKKFSNVDYKEYDAIFIPGGPHHKSIYENNDVKEAVDYFFTNNKVVSAICAAPTILGKWGYLKNKNYTCFTSMNDDFGGTYVDTYAVIDGKLVTGRSAAATIDFGFAVIEVLCGKEKEQEVKKEIYY